MTQGLKARRRSQAAGSIEAGFDQVALGVIYLLERTRLWTDALLNIVYSSSLAIGTDTVSFKQV